MQCGYCGTQLPIGAVHCPSCGTITPNRISESGISPYDLTIASLPDGAAQPLPIPTNYGSTLNPYEETPYSLPNPYGVDISQQQSPPPLLPRRQVKSGLVIGILTLVLILVSGISVSALFAQRAVPLDKSQTVTLNAQTGTPNVSSFETSFYYRLTNNFLGTGQSLDVKSDGSYLLKMAQTGNYSGQFWKLVDLGAGKYALRTAYLGDGFSLDVINDGTNNTPRMNATGNYSSQFWSLVPWGDGTYMLTNDFTGPEKSLDTYSDTHEPFLDSGDHSEQHWTLTQLTRIPA